MGDRVSASKLEHWRRQLTGDDFWCGGTIADGSCEQHIVAGFAHCIGSHASGIETVASGVILGLRFDWSCDSRSLDGNFRPLVLERVVRRLPAYYGYRSQNLDRSSRGNPKECAIS